MQKEKFIMPNYSKEDLDKLEELKKELPYNEEIIRILYTRGYKTVDDIDIFLNSNINYMNDASLLRDADKFVEILRKAIENNWLIVNYTDYDADGCCSAGVLLRSVRNIGGNIVYYTNNRFIGGYGMNVNGVKLLVEKYPDVKLIITTDNGISSHEAVEYAKSLGIIVIVTDHHEVSINEDGSQNLPKADAVVDAKRKDEIYPFDGMCGCGLIFKLMLYYYWATGEDVKYIYSLLDIVALATQSDVVPLQNENRIFIKEGLKLMNKDSRLCFELLKHECGILKVDEVTLGFSFGPAINALGRIEGCIDKAIDFLTIDDEEYLIKTAKELVKINEYRKEISNEQQEIATEEIEKNGEIPNVIVSYREDYHEGVIGIVAGRLKERFNRPAIVLSPSGSDEHGRIWKASARSLHPVHMYESLKKLSSYLITFGGHEMAAGFSMYEDQIEPFKKAFNELLEGIEFKKEILIDAILDAKTLDLERLEELELLKPFGEGFPKPLFGLFNFEVDITRKTRYDSKGGLRVSNKEGLMLLMFGQGEYYKNMGEPIYLKAIGSPSINTFNGKSYPQFIIKDTYLVKDNKKRS